METAYSDTITGPLYPLGPANDLTNGLIDSGVTSHFTPHPKDLHDMEPCQIKVTVTDGSTVMATHTDKVTILFTSNQEKETKLILHVGLYVTGITKRLFLIQSFCSNRNYIASTSNQFNQLDFGDGTTLTLSIIRAGVEANNSETATSNKQQILPLMLMELIHMKMGHRQASLFR
eukprot:11052590-Ditylum_brightwellii.AAC.1